MNPDQQGAAASMSAYAIRQLNPFSGMLQVLETDLARAFSNNGVLWRIQVVGDRPEHTWHSADRQVQQQFFNWGLWSAAEGLHRVSANPLLDIGAMQRAAAPLLAQLPQRQELLPFALADRFEYWACDYRSRPVALIASTASAQYAKGSPDTAWHATHLADHGFESAALTAAGRPNRDGYCPRAHAEYLESAVRHRAQARFWFERSADGSGRRLDNGLTLDADAFPALGLETDWDEPLVGGLVQDYLCWQAPLLLLLPLPGSAERARLEEQARRRAELVADLYRLYPRIMHPELIEQARVEARLRRA
jgi:hypothetical protein